MITLLLGKLALKLAIKAPFWLGFNLIFDWWL